jgi:hypothetical protein
MEKLYQFLLSAAEGARIEILMGRAGDELWRTKLAEERAPQCLADRIRTLTCP